MKISNEENIDIFFKRLENHVIEPDISQVEDMKIRLEGMRYYSFGWKHFNVYHLGIIGISFILSLWTFADRFIYGNVEKNNIVVIADTIYIRDTVLNVSKINNKVQKQYKNDDAEKIKLVPPKNTNIAIGKNNQDSLLAPSSNKNGNKEEILTNSTLAHIGKTDSVHFSKSVLPKQRRVIYITKKDTVYKYDTTKVVRKK